MLKITKYTEKAFHFQLMGREMERRKQPEGPVRGVVPTIKSRDLQMERVSYV